MKLSLKIQVGISNEQRANQTNNDLRDFITRNKANAYQMFEFLTWSQSFRESYFYSQKATLPFIFNRFVVIAFLILGLDFVQHAWLEKKVAYLDYKFVKLTDGVNLLKNQEEEFDSLYAIQIGNIWLTLKLKMNIIWILSALICAAASFDNNDVVYAKNFGYSR